MDDSTYASPWPGHPAQAPDLIAASTSGSSFSAQTWQEWALAKRAAGGTGGFVSLASTSAPRRGISEAFTYSTRLGEVMSDVDGSVLAVVNTYNNQRTIYVPGSAICLDDLPASREEVATLDRTTHRRSHHESGLPSSGSSSSALRRLRASETTEIENNGLNHDNVSRRLDFSSVLGSPVAVFAVRRGCPSRRVAAPATLACSPNATLRACLYHNDHHDDHNDNDHHGDNNDHDHPTATATPARAPVCTEPPAIGSRRGGSSASRGGRSAEAAQPRRARSQPTAPSRRQRGQDHL